MLSSDWIEEETRITRSVLSKPLVAVIPWGAEQVPSIIRDAASRLVGWNTDSVVGAVRELDP